MADQKSKRTKLGTLVLAIGGAAALPFACDDRPKEPTSSTATPPAMTAAAKPPAGPGGDAKPSAASPAPAGEISWTKPAAWKDGKSASAMRKATYVIPKADGDTDEGELSVIVAGGSAQANIERWEGQLGGSKAKTGQKNPNGVAVTTVDIEGEFSGGGPMMGGSSEKKSGWMLLGAIVSLTPSEHYFFKLTGPKKSVEAARKDFDALVESIKPAK
jgi:hypothetical protein